MGSLGAPDMGLCVGLDGAEGEANSWANDGTSWRANEGERANRDGMASTSHKINNEALFGIKVANSCQRCYGSLG
jgi:hypothetical protein